MARSYTEQGYDVIAAINGGFFGLLNPAGEQLINQGVLIHHGELLRHWDPEANNEYIAQEHYIIGALKNGEFFHGYNPEHTMHISVNGGEEFILPNLNNPRSSGNPWWRDLNLLTGRFDSSISSSPDNLAGRDVILEIISGQMAFGEELIMQVRQTAQPAQNNLPVGENQAVLTASFASDMAFLNGLNEGDIITVRHTVANRRGTNIDWSQVDQAIAAHYLLIRNGRRQPLPEQPGALTPNYPAVTPNPNTENPLPRLPGQNTKRPRTAVGLRADGSMVWVVVSGSANTGMTMPEFQDYLMSLDLIYAWNFDGGGSSTMTVGETFVTYANGADSAFQRSVANGLVLVVPELSVPFVDIYPGHWFAHYVMSVYSNNLMSGTSTSPMIFNPNVMLTRDTFVTSLYRHAGESDVSEFANPFTDVSENMRYTDAIKWAAHHGIVQGVGGGRFAPGENITREQIAVIVQRYTNTAGHILPDIHNASDFADQGDISDWAAEAVEEIKNAGIIFGRPGNLFDPHGNVTRAEAAAILHRFTENVIIQEPEQEQGYEVEEDEGIE
jgi:hypothetical protein